MKTNPEQQIEEVDPDLVMPMISRERDEVEFVDIVADINSNEQDMPVSVTDISHLPEEKRRNPEGGFYRYRINSGGEGRTTAAKLLKKKLRVVIEPVKEVRAIGMAITENFNRVGFTWHERAELIRDRVDRGETLDGIAGAINKSPKHVQKMVRCLKTTAPGLEDEVRKMSMNQAESFTSLKPSHQGIIIETLRETGERDIVRLVEKLKEVQVEDPDLSKLALKQSMKRVDEDLARWRQRIKPTRLHNSLGPLNVKKKLKNKKIYARLKSQGVNVAKFEEIMQ